MMKNMQNKKLFLVSIFIVLFYSISFAQETKLNSTIDKNALKFTFLSWFSGSTKFSYERAFPEVKQSGEICAGLICAGYDKYNNSPLGFTLRYGHKFFIGEYSYSKPLDGFFLRPEIIYSHFSYDSKTLNSNLLRERNLAQMTALLGTFGYQKTFGNFIIDGWVGAGLAFGNPADTGYHHGFQLWNWFNSYNENIALSFSIRLGWCF